MCVMWPLYICGVTTSVDKWIMSHICTSHVTHTSESGHTYEWVTKLYVTWILWHESFICGTLPPVTKLYWHRRQCTSAHTCPIIHAHISSHKPVSRVTHMNASPIELAQELEYQRAHPSNHTHTHIVTQTNKSCHTYECVTNCIGTGGGIPARTPAQSYSRGLPALSLQVCRVCVCMYGMASYTRIRMTFWHPFYVPHCRFRYVG